MTTGLKDYFNSQYELYLSVYCSQKCQNNFFFPFPFPVELALVKRVELKV